MWVRAFSLCVLILVGCGVWLYARMQGAGSESGFLIFVGSYCFWHWGKPWQWRADAGPAPWLCWGVALAFLVVGLASGLQGLLALGWCLGLWGWLSAFVEMESRRRLAQSIVVLLFMFPWVGVDGWLVEWYFRLSASSVAEHVLMFMGFDVVRSGVHLWVNGLELNVAPSCAGLNTLSGTLFFGSVLAYAFLGGKNSFWGALCLLPLIAWLSNTVRISMLCWAAASWGPSFLTEMLHQWGGLIILALSMSAYVGLLGLLRTYILKRYEY